MIYELEKFVNSNHEIWNLFKKGDYKDIKPIVEKQLVLHHQASKKIVDISTKIGDILLAN